MVDAAVEVVVGLVGVGVLAASWLSAIGRVVRKNAPAISRPAATRPLALDACLRVVGCAARTRGGD